MQYIKDVLRLCFSLYYEKYDTRRWPFMMIYEVQQLLKVNLNSPHVHHTSTLTDRATHTSDIYTVTAIFHHTITA